MEKRLRSANYQAYLLRLRRDGRGQWTAHVTNPHTAETWTFASLRQLVSFLEDRTGEAVVDEGRTGE